MLRLTAASRLVLDVAVLLMLAPLALECASGVAGRFRHVGTRLVMCALSVLLAAAFVLPRISANTRVETRAELLNLARTAQLSGGGILQLDSVVGAARQRPDLRELAELLVLANGGNARSD